MTFENLFEDLEALFEAQLSNAAGGSGLQTKNLAIIDQLSGQKATLLAPVMGLDFIAGVPLGEDLWRIFQFSGLSRMMFSEAAVGKGSTKLPRLKEVTITMADCLAQLPLPIYLTWRQIGSEEARAGQLVQVVDSLVAIQVVGATEPGFYPLAGITEVSIRAVENFGAIL
jgi:hypothetical protein